MFLTEYGPSQGPALAEWTISDGKGQNKVESGLGSRDIGQTKEGGSTETVPKGKARKGTSKKGNLDKSAATA